MGWLLVHEILALVLYVSNESSEESAVLSEPSLLLTQGMNGDEGSHQN